METLSQFAAAVGLSNQVLFILLAGATVTCLGFALFSIFSSGKDPLRRRLAEVERDAAIPALTAFSQRYYEARLREEPAQWLWLHDRWKVVDA